MAENIKARLSLGTAAVGQAAVDEGLRAYMLRVYNYMASGVALSGIVAALVASSPALLQAIYGTGLFWIVILAPFGFLLVLAVGLNRLSVAAVQALFWAFAAVMGAWLSSIFLAYTSTSIVRVFFITTATFAAMSLYGYTTKRDLTGMGNFMLMGLWGIIIASVVNFFLASSALHFAISVIGVLVFVGLTAYDTQKIREMYFEADGADATTKKAVMGALTLYLDFILLMIMLLRLFGERR